MKLSANQAHRLDVIRIVATVMIFATHAFSGFGYDYNYIASAGVQIFLFLSGYLLVLKPDAGTANWYFARAIRILPAYYLTLMLTALLFLVVAKNSIIGTDFLLHFTTLHYFFYIDYPIFGGHFWYITIMVICYLIMPLIIKFDLAMPSLKSTSILATPIIVIAIICIYIKLNVPDSYKLIAKICWSTADIYIFIAGAMLRRRHGGDVPRAYPVLIIAFLAVASVASLIIRHSLYSPPVRILFGISVFLALFSIPCEKIATWRPAKWVGKHSYEIYLTHHNFLLGPLSILSVTGNKPLNLALAVAATILASATIHQLSQIIQKKLSPLDRL